MHLIHAIFALGVHLGSWLDAAIGDFQLGTTAKEVIESEIGIYGVGAYLTYKTAGLSLDMWSTIRPAWIPGRLLHAALALGSSAALTIVLVLIYLGVLGALVQLQTTVSAALMSIAAGWIGVGYRRLTDLAQVRIEAQQTERED